MCDSPGHRGPQAGPTGGFDWSWVRPHSRGAVSRPLRRWVSQFPAPAVTSSSPLLQRRPLFPQHPSCFPRRRLGPPQGPGAPSPIWCPVCWPWPTPFPWTSSSPVSRSILASCALARVFFRKENLDYCFAFLCLTLSAALTPAFREADSAEILRSVFPHSCLESILTGSWSPSGQLCPDLLPPALLRSLPTSPFEIKLHLFHLICLFNF